MVFCGPPLRITITIGPKLWAYLRGANVGDITFLADYKSLIYCLILYFITPFGTRLIPLLWGIVGTGVKKDKLPHLICKPRKKVSRLHGLRVQIQRKKLPLNSQKRFWVEITLVRISNSFYLPCCCFLVYDDLKSLFTKLVTETGWHFWL